MAQTGQLLPILRPTRPAGPDRGPAAEPLLRELVGRTLRDVRRARGERLVDVAERAGVSPQYLSEVERGMKDPSSEILGAVTGALQLPLRELTLRVAGDLAVGSAPATAATGTRGPVCLAA